MPTKTTSKTAARKTAPARKPVKAAVRAEPAEPKRKKTTKSSKVAPAEKPKPAARVAKAKARVQPRGRSEGYLREETSHQSVARFQRPFR